MSRVVYGSGSQQRLSQDGDGYYDEDCVFLTKEGERETRYWIQSKGSKSAMHFLALEGKYMEGSTDVEEAM